MEVLCDVCKIAVDLIQRGELMTCCVLFCLIDRNVDISEPHFE